MQFTVESVYVKITLGAHLHAEKPQIYLLLVLGGPLQCAPPPLPLQAEVE